MWGKRKRREERLNSPPWLPAPEIHISCRTRVLLAPGRFHSKLRVGEGVTEQSCQPLVSPPQSNRGGGGEETRRTKTSLVGGAAPQTRDHSIKQDHKKCPTP